MPPFAAGQVRDHRLRWVLEEVGWPYEVVLVDAPTMASPAYREMQPFGQVPVMEEDGRPPMFETGAIVLDVALRSGKLLPPEGAERSQALSWYISALNSIEPFLMNVAEVEFFTRDPERQAARRPHVVAFAKKRLAAAEEAVGDRTWLAGDAFTIADLMLSSVLKVAGSTGLLDGFPRLSAHQARCFARPAHRKAIADQLAVFDAHAMADMRYDEVKKRD